MFRTYEKGRIVPGAEVVVKEIARLLTQYSGRAVELRSGGRPAMRPPRRSKKRMSTGVGCAVLRRCCHVGRLGAYVEMAARQNCVALACGGAAGEGHWVAPFGGREGRLGTNPIAFGAPTQSDPIVVDFATSSVARRQGSFLARNRADASRDDPGERAAVSTARDPADLYVARRHRGGSYSCRSADRWATRATASLSWCRFSAACWAHLPGPKATYYTGSNNLFVLALAHRILHVPR